MPTMTRPRPAEVGLSDELADALLYVRAYERSEGTGPTRAASDARGLAAAMSVLVERGYLYDAPRGLSRYELTRTERACRAATRERRVKPLRTMRDVRAANAAIGHAWFTPATMRFFDSRIESPFYGLVSGQVLLDDGTPADVAGYFIHSRQFTGSDGTSNPRTFHVAAVSSRGEVSPRGYEPSPFPGGYASLHEAQAAVLVLLSPEEHAFAYGAVAAELPELTLDDLDQQIVAQAKAYASSRSLPWPPAPASDGWDVTVRSLR